MKITIINKENDTRVVLNAKEEIVKELQDNKDLEVEILDNEVVITTDSINFWCLVFGHAWLDNVCTRCGATR